ncbi:hypothetical protein BESB_037300 [Besnoitia besnoiti]|uniref:Ubiquitin thioesterase OTU n=1 Tax=Besnoitia besnoiti TaxID=94643 RepID=A0A2A9MNK9_BESBE|nr:hypothetical protein BESB_037300 [Besnoitia besnoiti]PFH37272.1 hypothetical protein BESB_037300 [Besnoitia besnoiti]
MRALTVVFALLSVRICAALVLPSASRGVKLFREQSPTNQVPGDGACLFTSLAACLWWASFGTHPKFEDRVFLDMIDFIRQLAVDTLQDARIVALALEGDEVISRQSLVELAASGYGVSPEAYCERMRLPTTWGGGPEIIALSHALGRVIVVYEVADQLSMTRDPPDLTLAPRGQTIGYGQTLGTCTGSPDTESYQVLKIAACLGFPHNITEDPLHILFARSAACTNGIRPSGGQPADHFLPLFPCLAQ